MVSQHAFLPVVTMLTALWMVDLSEGPFFFWDGPRHSGTLPYPLNQEEA